MGKERSLPLLTDDEFERKVFLEAVEGYIDGRFKEKLKEEEPHDTERMETLCRIVNRLQQTEANGYHVEDEKKVKVCRCSNCSHSRQHDVDFFLDEINQITAKYGSGNRLESFRKENSRIWELKLVIPKRG